VAAITCTFVYSWVSAPRRSGRLRRVRKWVPARSALVERSRRMCAMPACLRPWTPTWHDHWRASAISQPLRGLRMAVTHSPVAGDDARRVCAV